MRQQNYVQWVRRMNASFLQPSYLLLRYPSHELANILLFSLSPGISLVSKANLWQMTPSWSFINILSILLAVKQLQPDGFCKPWYITSGALYPNRTLPHYLHVLFCPEEHAQNRHSVFKNRRGGRSSRRPLASTQKIRSCLLTFILFLSPLLLIIDSKRTACEMPKYR